MDRWLTKTVQLEGGILENIPPIIQGQSFEGSLLEGVNFEPSTTGGYSRLRGYSKYETSAVPGAGRVKGVFVFKDGVIAARSQNIYYSTGSGWGSALNSTLFNSSSTKFRGYVYDFSIPSTEKIIIVNSFDYPVTFDGTTFTHLTNSSFSKVPTDLEGATSVASFKRHMFLTKGQVVYFSAPGDETSFSPIDGGGAIQLGREVFALHEWRDSLYIFGPESIHKIVGDNSTNFSVQSVTEDLGTFYPDSIKEIGGDLIYLTQDGLRTIAGTERIGDIALDNLTRTIDGRLTLLDFRTGNKEISCAVLRQKNQYRLFAGDSTLSRTDSRGILGALRRSLDGNINWEWFDTLGIQASTADSGFIGRTETIVHGDFDGFVYRQENGSSFDGNPISARLKFPFWTYANADGTINNEVRKTLYKLRIYMTSEGPVSPTIGATLDFLDSEKIQPATFDGSTGTSGFFTYGDSLSVYDTSTYAEDTEILTNFNLIGTCFNSSFFIESNDTKEPYTVETITVQYGVGGRR